MTCLRELVWQQGSLRVVPIHFSHNAAAELPGWARAENAHPPDRGARQRSAARNPQDELVSSGNGPLPMHRRSCRTICRTQEIGLRSTASGQIDAEACLQVRRERIIGYCRLWRMSGGHMEVGFEVRLTNRLRRCARSGNDCLKRDRTDRTVDCGAIGGIR
jgi:hypothetical protein